MKLPRFDGMAEALKRSNVIRQEALIRVKEPEVKRKRSKAKGKHRQSEQTARKLWVQKQKLQHSYGKKLPSEKKVKTEKVHTTNFY